MRCIGASAAPEDAQEEANQHSPTRRARRSQSPGPTEAVAAVSGADKTVADSDDAAILEAEVFGVAELAEMATMLLNMILELYGKQIPCWFPSFVM